MKEAVFYKKIKGSKVQCRACNHFCVIENEKRGKCGVRANLRGKLYSTVYGKAAALGIDPIEKKPFFHFFPGTYSLSVATVGCNFTCDNCQNYEISQKRKSVGRDLSPEKLVEIALEKKIPGISYTYVEPTIFVEYALDIMNIAKSSGVKNSWVSNGFMSREVAEAIIPLLDAVNIDIKSFSEDFYAKNCGGRLKPVLENAELMKKSGVWVEITTLVIPGLSDSEEMLDNIAKFIYKKLGPDTPWHVSRFSGAISWKLEDFPETPIETLEKAYQIGKNAGLKYVYTGNLPGAPYEDTYCSKCRSKMIDRTGYEICRRDEEGKCSKCGEDLDLILN